MPSNSPSPWPAALTGPTLYQQLQLDPSAEPDVIEAAYKRLALRYHPDRDKSPEAGQRMQVINEARRVLADPDLREQYDRLDRPQPQAFTATTAAAATSPSSPAPPAPPPTPNPSLAANRPRTRARAEQSDSCG